MRQFTLNMSDKPLWITENLVFLEEIPQKFLFEWKDPGKRKIILADGSTEPDLMLDDSTLAFTQIKDSSFSPAVLTQGFAIFTEYARKVCEERQIVDITVVSMS